MDSHPSRNWYVGALHYFFGSKFLKCDIFLRVPFGGHFDILFEIENGEMGGGGGDRILLG